MATRQTHARQEGNRGDGKDRVDFKHAMISGPGSFSSHLEQTLDTNPEELLGAAQTAHKMAPRSGLATPAPFHLEATVRVLQRRPSNPVDVWEHDRYLRVLALPEGLALVEVENCGTIDQPDVRFLIRGGNASSATRLAAGGALRKILGLDVDPQSSAVSRGS